MSRPDPHASHSQRWRAPLASVMVVLGCLLAPVAVVGIWTANEISDTGRYVENVTPLASDPVIQSAVADRVTTAIVQRVDLAEVVDQAVAALEGRGLPKAVGTELEGLSGPLASGLQTFIHAQALKVTQSDAFKKAWVTANTAAHTQLKAILSGDGSKVLTVQGDTVSVDLTPIVSIVKQRLVASGMSLASAVPEVHTTLRLFESEDLVKAQTAHTWLNRLRWVLPVLSLLLIAAGVYVAKARRRTLIGAGLGLAIAMLALGTALAVTRTVIVDHASDNGLAPAVTGHVFDTLIRFLRDGLRAIAVVGLLVTAGAFVTGPATVAKRTRSALKRVIASPRTNGASADPV